MMLRHCVKVQVSIPGLVCISSALGTRQLGDFE